jgi:hypothetical protein
MKPSKRVFVEMVACWGAMTLGGCGPAAVDDLPRQPVSGKVTLDGKPLEQGTITFSPTTELPTPGMVSITGGSYSIPGTQGLVAGTYKVSIEVADTTEPVEKFGDLPGVAGRHQAEAADKKKRAEVLGKKGASSSQAVPARYNTATTLTATVEDGGTNSFDFDLTSDATPKK